MKNIFKLSAAALALTLCASSCIQEIDPQTSTVTSEQAENAPGAFDNYVNAITGTLTGTFIYNNSTNPWNFGLPSLYLQRDCMTQDIVIPDLGGNDWYSGWYTVSSYVTSESNWASYLPWLYYYGWISSCNKVLNIAGEEPTDSQKSGVGIAYAMRAYYYMDLAMTFGQGSYTANSEALTVPIVTETSTTEELLDNPRASFKDLFAFILSDLDEAEKYLADYERTDKTTPDLSVVYGLKARAYLVMGDWAQAKTYARKAIDEGGYEMLEPSELTDQANAFNNPNNNSWMMCMTLKSTDVNITANDADTGWGSQMIAEVGPSGCGYAANYVGPKRIDKHLFETIPETDYRRDEWVDFALDDYEYDGPEMRRAILKYTSNADNFSFDVWSSQTVGGVPVKFRPANGEHKDQYTAFTVSIPMMRCEEMLLIEAEAAGRIKEADGIDLLEAFAKARDPQYVYGVHIQDNNYGGSISGFLREIQWQRRVELWGEGFAMFDAKRLGTNMIRNYPGTNHPEGYRWNTTSTPAWYTLLITDSEANYNKAIGTTNQNPSLTRPDSDSEEYNW